MGGNKNKNKRKNKKEKEKKNKIKTEKTYEGYCSRCYKYVRFELYMCFRQKSLMCHCGYWFSLQEKDAYILKDLTFWQEIKKWLKKERRIV